MNQESAKMFSGFILMVFAVLAAMSWAFMFPASDVIVPLSQMNLSSMQQSRCDTQFGAGNYQWKEKDSFFYGRIGVCEVSTAAMFKAGGIWFMIRAIISIIPITIVLALTLLQLREAKKDD